MKRKLTSLIIVLTMIVSMLTACEGEKKETSKEEPVKEVETVETLEESDEDEVSDETVTLEKKDTKVSEEGPDLYKKSEETDQYLTYVGFKYADGMGEDPLNIDPVGEDGNTYNFNTDHLGYYTNGIVGFNFYQVNGGKVKSDIFLYDYYVGWCDYIDVIDEDTITFVYDKIMESDNTEQMMVNGSMTDALEGTITFNDDGTFEITDSFCISEVFNMCMMQDAHNYFYMAESYFYEQSDNPSNSVFDTAAFGKYIKQDDEEIKNLKMINQYSLYDNGYDEEYHYANNQPVEDRLTKEKFPKVVGSIPRHEWYIGGGDPDNLEPFVLVHVMTASNSELSESMNTSIEVETIPLCRSSAIYESETEPTEFWNRTVETYDYAFTNFNYDIPEYEATMNDIFYCSLIGGNSELEEQYDYTKFHNRAKLTVNENDTITLTGDVYKNLSIYSHFNTDEGRLDEEEIIINIDGVELTPFDNIDRINEEFLIDKDNIYGF